MRGKLATAWPGRRISTFCLIALASISVDRCGQWFRFRAAVPFAPDQKRRAGTWRPSGDASVVLFRFNPIRSEAGIVIP